MIDAMLSNKVLALDALARTETAYQDLPVDTANRFRIGVIDADRRAILSALADIDVTVYVLFDSRRVAKRHRLQRVDRASLDLLEDIGRQADIWRVFEYLALPDGSDAFGDLHGCELEFWTRYEQDESFRSRRWNELAVRLEPADFGSAASDCPLASQVTFPIDVVYTWVDGDDPRWQERRARWSDDDVPRHDEAMSAARFESRDELRYSLRSIERFADFVRQVYIVTDDQCPAWLNTDAEGLTLVDHSEIFPVDALPTFNSHAIEARLHHIPGLAEHYIYLNDDFLLGRRVGPEKFFYSNGLAKQFRSRALIPRGAASIDNKPVDAAAMNGRQLVEERFGVTPTRKFKHAPYPQLKSVNLELESLFPADMKRTMGSRFRHSTDIAVASSLHHHVAYIAGRSVPASITSRYVDLGAWNLKDRLDRLLTYRDFDAICLNDSDTGLTSVADKNEFVSEFLEAYLPAKSRFEI
ncbi:MAG: stealth conserved region 3 domain-containing protein [Actinomycetota bacterium]